VTTWRSTAAIVEVTFLAVTVARSHWIIVGMLDASLLVQFPTHGRRRAAILRKMEIKRVSVSRGNIHFDEGRCPLSSFSASIRHAHVKEGSLSRSAGAGVSLWP